jgi:hypothetical protein
MTHAHTWRVTATVLLELPDARGYADRVIAWQCPCGQALWITGSIREGEPLRTPEFWTRLIHEHQAEPMQRVAMREAQVRIG